MKYSVLCPPLTPSSVSEVVDFKLCNLSRRPAFLKIEGGRLSEEGFLTEVRVDGNMSLYKGTWSLIKTTLDLIRKGKLKVIPLAGTEKRTAKAPTEKQKSLIKALCEELNEKHPIPATRKDASLLIEYLLTRKRALRRKKAVRKTAA